MPKNTQLGQQVMDYLALHPDTALSTRRIAADLGSTPQQISNSLSHWMTEKKLPGLVRLGRGIYRYTPGPERQASRIGQMFEQIGVTRDGAILVRGEDEIVYKLGDPL